MPKDKWRNETQKINARRNKLEADRSRKRPPEEREPKLKIVMAGSPILARRKGDGEFKKIKTTKNMIFLDASAITDKAMLIEIGEWEMWVAKTLVKNWK